MIIHSYIDEHAFILDTHALKIWMLIKSHVNAHALKTWVLLISHMYIHALKNGCSITHPWMIMHSHINAHVHVDGDALMHR